MKKRIMLALSVAILSLSTVSVMAATTPSVSADEIHKITVGDSTSTSAKVEGGTIETSTNSVEDGKEVTLTAKPDKGYEFVEWIIDGDYEIVDGDLNSETITIIPKGDLDVDALFEENGETVEDGKTDKGDKDNSTTSPTTGAAAGALFVTLLASGGVAVVSKKKYTK